MKTCTRQFNLIEHILLGLIVIALTWQSGYLQGKLNLFELGLYLPGIDSILHGQIPFRDFFYLRGPFELYVPAFLMRLGGEQVWILATYFYVGTVLTLIVAAWIGKELISSRPLLYTMAIVLVVRTFPRVVFTFWGGLRYAWGLMAILCLIRFFKTRRFGWVVASGMLTAIGFWTSIEIGVSSLIAALGALLVLRLVGYDKNTFGKIFGYFITAFLGCVFAYGCYLYANGALKAYVQSVLTITTQMNKVFLQTEKVPSNAIEVLGALFNPSNKNFRQMTPLWGYIFLSAYLWIKHRRYRWDELDKGVLVLGFYGLMLYIGAFRNLWASQFEMALQPWKIIQFFLLGQILSAVAQTKGKQFNQRLVYGVVLGVILVSSFVYAGGRLKKRFFKSPLEGQAKVELNVPRAKGMIVPNVQAQDLEELNNFLSAQTSPGESVLMFPEMGAVHFMVNRPAVGRFAHATMSWLSPEWQQEWFHDIQSKKPLYAVVLKEPPAYFEKAYFPVENNRVYYEAAMKYIRHNYEIVSQTPSYYIYQLRGTNEN